MADKQKKPMCFTSYFDTEYKKEIKCTRKSQYMEGKTPRCLGCIDNENRKNASHKKMEHNILSDISRKLDNVKWKITKPKIEIRYDQIYTNKQRPDMLITDISGNKIDIEVDEKQHFKKEELIKDEERINTFKTQAYKDGNKFSVIRIVPGENKEVSMFKRKNKSALYKTNDGYIQKDSKNYNKFIKHTVHQIKETLEKYHHKEDDYKKLSNIGPNELSPTGSYFSNGSSSVGSPNKNRAMAILKSPTTKRYKTPLGYIGLDYWKSLSPKNKSVFTGYRPRKNSSSSSKSNKSSSSSKSNKQGSFYKRLLPELPSKQLLNNGYAESYTKKKSTSPYKPFTALTNYYKRKHGSSDKMLEISEYRSKHAVFDPGYNSGYYNVR